MKISAAWKRAIDGEMKNLRTTTNFYYPLLLLRPPKRRAMEWLYRFCRKADDIADDAGSTSSKRKALARLRHDLLRGWQKGSNDPLIRPLIETGKPLGLTLGPLKTILEGVEQDIKRVNFKTFHELYAYALKVAGGPGLASMEIFGFNDGPHRAYAQDLAVFLQLVNVVRDVAEDSRMGRRYLPADEWKRYGLPTDRLPEPGPVWDSYARFQLQRASGFWGKACEHLDRHARGRLATAEAIAAVYRCLHRKLEETPSLALKGRLRLSTPEKLSAVAGSTLRCLFWRGLLNP